LTRRPSYAIVAVVCALPRIALAIHEHSGITSNLEKSSGLARMFLKTGTFGYVPGEPTAYTQPLYGWFLIVVYWIAGFHWWSIAGSQILVAVATSVVVCEIGRRFLSPRIGLTAALIATLQPYLVWHDIHGNREILDQLIGVAIFLLALLAASRRSIALTAALGLVCGIGILSNARLTVLPLCLLAYLLWRRAGWAVAIVVPLLAAVAVAPWVVRNKIEVGCWAITTDARSIWKANNVNTYAVLKSGLWIDQVPDIPQRQVSRIPDRWQTPEAAGFIYESSGRKVDVPECAQQSYYEHLVIKFWEHHPGEKAKLAVQATEMMWNPRVGVEGAQESGVDPLRKWVEPLYTVPLFLLAIVGFFLVPSTFRALAAIFIVYETAAAWVFAGTTRYRVPWDFVLAILAAAALERLWSKLAVRRARARPATT
jgi:4-amino-4-deoxy-L-arabinose transferase-like glycosyltransferase